MANKSYDFSGWATKCNYKCADGRTIGYDAFADDDGKKVPLVWGHDHSGPENVLGHAILENRGDGVYAYCTLNDSEKAKMTKHLIEHGDIDALSIWANGLKEKFGNVMHGCIRELSVVLSGANPGALIENVVAHDGLTLTDEAIIWNDNSELEMYHSATDDDDESDTTENKDNKDDDDDETIADVFDTLTEKQKTVVYALIGSALGEAQKTQNKPDDEGNDKGGEKTMKHNAFDNFDTSNDNVLSHEAQGEILELAKNPSVSTLRNAIVMYCEDNELAHDAVSGFVQEGPGGVSELFPEYKNLGPAAPELLTNDLGWVDVVMNKVHKSPISRIRTRYVDIRNMDALRAKGYQKKGNFKKPTGNFTMVHRTTDPQTVYVKNVLHKDDITDIVDFDYVSYLYNIDRMSMKEELATAIMIGDGRDISDEDKIHEDHIRPIWTDDEIYTLHRDLDLEAAKAELQGTETGAHFGENYILAEAMIASVLYAREKSHCSGTPDMFITPHMLNVMLLAKDQNGRRIYNSKADLTAAFNVGNIYTVEQFEGKTRTTEDMQKKKLLAIIVNLSDYQLGATKGGELTHFTQFDIDFNQMKSLLETRKSGALVKVESAIVIEEDITEAP